MVKNESEQMISVDALTRENFAPFGEVVETPGAPARDYFSGSLRNSRPHGRPSLSMAYRAPTALPLVATVMERHRFSSQTFIPTDAGRWLVLVAPNGVDGGPDMTRARAFLPGPGQGITFAADIWHHPLTVFDRPGTFAIFMWLDGTNGDEEFFPLAAPVPIAIA